MKKNKFKVAVVPGSFDPITYGHIDIVKRAAEKYDKVYLAVMINNNKNYMFTMDERVRIAKAAICDFANVEVISSEGMLWELAKALSADAIVKGYRNEKDLAYEMEMAEYNKEHYPLAETVLLKANDKLRDVSSTVAREMIQTDESLKALIPDGALKEIKDILNNK